MSSITFWLSGEGLFLFYKNLVYKNVQTEIWATLDGYLLNYSRFLENYYERIVLVPISILNTSLIGGGRVEGGLTPLWSQMQVCRPGL